MKQNGQDYSYLYDGKGNVTALLDGTQSVVASYGYSPFGRLMAKEGSVDQPFQFSTKRYDEQTGLSYFGYRFYYPSVGRWTTRDPIGLAGGDLNLYGFVLNNPVNFYDPLGLARGDWWDPRTYMPDLEGAERIARQVLRETQQNFPNSPLRNDIADAWRHARWAERMVNEIGWGTAVIAGYGYELENLYDQWRRGVSFR